MQQCICTTLTGFTERGRCRVLRIYFGSYDAENYIQNPAGFFDNACEDAWLENAHAKEMVMDIDRTELVNASLVISPALGSIPVSRLSGSVKAMIMIANDQTHVYNASVCGDSCAPWLLRIGVEKDILVRLGHLMHFTGEPFEIMIENNGERVHTQKELVCAVIMNGFLDE